MRYAPLIRSPVILPAEANDERPENQEKRRIKAHTEPQPVWNPSREIEIRNVNIDYPRVGTLVNSIGEHG